MDRTHSLITIVDDDMSFAYTIDPKQRIVFSVAKGIFSEADGDAHQAQLRHDARFDPTFRQLCDFSQVVRFDLTASAIWSFAYPTIFAPTARRAFLVPSEVSFGLARMFEILRNLAGEAGIRVFRDRGAALAWLYGDA